LVTSNLSNLFLSVLTNGTQVWLADHVNIGLPYRQEEETRPLVYGVSFFLHGSCCFIRVSF